MTNPSSAAPEEDEADDQSERSFEYGHGRLPLFLKVAWLGFLAFATWYVVQFLLTSVGEEIGG